ncbi:MAG: fructosamine kinase family protein [Polyangiaceae bacterium]|nr:fructosamine kinase family protein [Polyangiaceae bacterium]
MNRSLTDALERALGARVDRSSAVGGGDINDSYAVTLTTGARVFAKTHASADPAMLPAEARGLDWLREAEAVRVPRVLAVSSGVAGEPAFLALEWLDSARPSPTFDEDLGRALAALHRYGASRFGLDHDNFIGRLPQTNRPCPTWEEFFRERRLGVQLALGRRNGRIAAPLAHAFDRLFGRLGDLLGPPEPPARLHGDLWGGNLHVDDRGAPALIDPAVYGGHREVDLAMMRLFGGFGSRVFAAYDEAYPLAPGHAERVELYQLYPLLVHVNLFGGSYVDAVDRIAHRYR